MTRAFVRTALGGAIGLATCLCGTSPAQQAQVCFTDSIPQMTTGWMDDLTFSKFDTALGILRSVEFRLNTTIVGQASFESLDMQPTTVTTTFAANITVFRPGGSSPILTNSPSQSFMTNVTAFDGTIDFAGTSGMTFPNISVNQINVQLSPPPPSDLVLFAGPAGMPGSITLPVTAAGASSGSGAGNLIQQFMQAAFASLEVCYNYDFDCDDDGISDLEAIMMGSSDCNLNDVPDECEILPGVDCNFNGIPDNCDVSSGSSMDANMNGIPDECDTSTPKCSGDGGNQMGCTNCPCGNNAVPGTIGGCLNSVASSARLYMTGFPSQSNDTMTMRVVGGIPSSFGVLFSSANAAPNNPMNPCFGLESGLSGAFFDGLRCLAAPVRRHPARMSDANGNYGVTTAPWGPPGGPPQGLIARGQWLPGQTICWQVYYREDAMLGCMTGVNTTNALKIIITP